MNNSSTSKETLHVLCSNDNKVLLLQSVASPVMKLNHLLLLIDLSHGETSPQLEIERTHSASVGIGVL